MGLETVGDRYALTGLTSSHREKEGGNGKSKGGRMMVRGMMKRE